jgi:hypothetical protein
MKESDNNIKLDAVHRKESELDATIKFKPDTGDKKESEKDNNASTNLDSNDKKKANDNDASTDLDSTDKKESNNKNDDSTDKKEEIDNLNGASKQTNKQTNKLKCGKCFTGICSYEWLIS